MVKGVNVSFTASTLAEVRAQACCLYVRAQQERPGGEVAFFWNDLINWIDRQIDNGLIEGVEE